MGSLEVRSCICCKDPSKHTSKDCPDTSTGLHEVCSIKLGPKSTMADFICWCGLTVEHHALWHNLPSGWLAEDFHLACEVADLWYEKRMGRF